MRIGSLVALEPGFPVEGLRIATESRPDGRVVDEFRVAWGFPIETATKSDCSDPGPECQWAKDMAEVFTALQVVDNNVPGTVGGGGVGRQPAAPPVGN